ncbi:MAG: O-antigen ligase family protein [Candidatus Omnitrophota bacterium]|nr:O-antigen ligase family protein [Candidatus Omnitrophota bacterium]
MSRVGSVVSHVQKGSLYVLLFLLPFSKAAIEVAFGVLLLGWLVARLAPTSRATTIWTSRSLRPVALAVGAYLGVCALSILVSSHPWLSVKGLVNKWLEYLLLFIIAADLAATPNVVTRSLTVMTWSSVFVVIEAVTQEVFRKGIFRGLPFIAYGRMSGPYENPIDLATYLMVVIPLLLAYALTLRGVRRRALWGVLLFVVACFIKTEAFGAWVGFALALGGLMMWQTTLRRQALVLLSAVVVGGGLLLWRVGKLGVLFSLSEVGKIDRWVMWQAAIGMIRDRPILGHGLNTFMANYLTYWVGGEQAPRYAHNCYLQVAAETGLIGLGAFLVLLWQIFAHIRRGVTTLPSQDRLILLGMIAGLFAFAVQAGVDTNFYSLRQAALFWTLAGLAVGCASRSCRPA